MAFFKFILDFFNKAAWVAGLVIIIATGYFYIYPIEIPACRAPDMEITDPAIARNRTLSLLQAKFKNEKYFMHSAGISYETFLVGAHIGKTSLVDNEPYADKVWYTFITYEDSTVEIEMSVVLAVCGNLGDIGILGGTKKGRILPGTRR